MSIIEIKVTLQDIEPAVTRTLQVPADIRLDRLHLTLQVAMGWTNSHLYMFEAARATWGIADPDFGGEDLPANKTTLGQVIEDTGKKTINYIYDFGDNWEHRIKIGRITDPVPGELYPRLIEVTGKCPPEDVGGFPGYYGFLDAMADPKHPEHDHLKDWYGGTSIPISPKPTNSNSKSSVSQNTGSPENQGNKAVRPDAYPLSAALLTSAASFATSWIVSARWTLAGNHWAAYATHTRRWRCTKWHPEHRASPCCADDQLF